MAGALIDGMLTGILVVVFVGFAAMEVLDVAAGAGIGVGLAAGLGVATGDGFWAAAAVSAGALISRVLAPWSGYLQWGAVAVLAGVWVRAIREVVRPNPDIAVWVPRSPGHAYRAYLAATLRDVVTVVFFGTLMLWAAPRYDAGQGAAFVAGVFLTSLTWQAVFAAVGARRGRVLSGQARRRVFGLDCVLLAVFIGYVLFGIR